jgi:hypothetical protein
VPPFGCDEPYSARLWTEECLLEDTTEPHTCSWLESSRSVIPTVTYPTRMTTILPAAATCYADSTLKDYANATPPLIYSKAEWRMGINLIGVDGFTVRNLRITETGGDGIQMGSCEKGPCIGTVARFNILSEFRARGVFLTCLRRHPLSYRRHHCESCRNAAGAVGHRNASYNVLVENCQLDHNVRCPCLIRFEDWVCSRMLFEAHPC